MQHGLAVQAGDDCLALCAIAAMNEHAGPFSDEPFSDRPADARGAAGDDDDFVLESHGDDSVARER
jgi:hypothetical protein